MILSALSIPLGIYLIVQAALFPFEVIHCLARKSDSSRLRFLLLTLISFSFNLGILFSINFFENGSTAQYFIPRCLAVVLVCYIYYYLVREQKIETNRKVVILAVLLCSIFTLEFVLLFYGISAYVIKTILVISFEVVIFLHSVKLVEHVRKDSVRISPLSVASSSIVVLAILCPLVLNFSKTDFIRVSVLNLPFFIIATIYIYEYIRQSKIEEDLIYNNTYLISQSLEERNQIHELLLDNRKFTTREKEIVILLLRGLNYIEIADQIKRTPATVRSHAKKIRSKLGVDSQKEFNKKYLNK